MSQEFRFSPIHFVAEDGTLPGAPEPARLIRQVKKLGRILILDANGQLELEYCPPDLEPDRTIVHAPNYRRVTDPSTL